MEFAITVENLKKRYEKKDVVRGISFSVKCGEIFGFLGPNGAGKTTSIKMMIGELPSDEGRIEILGKNMPLDREEIKNIMGVVPDHQNLYDRLTVRQNLDIFVQLYGVEPGRTNELLAMVDLQEHADVPTSKLSRGLRQRTLIARGLIHRPTVFFLDEPTSALDPHSALGIRHLIMDLKKAGTTVFITTHYMEEANQMCDRIAIMHHGQVVATDTPEALRLRFGKPTINVTLRRPTPEKAPGECLENAAPQTFEVIELPLNGSSSQKMAEYLASGNLLKVHSQEATLEEVFLNLTGDTWKTDEQEITPSVGEQQA